MSANLNIDLSVPSSIAEAIAQRAANPGSRYIAGGTDLVPNLRRGIAAPDLLISLEAIEDMKTISETENHIEIGAGMTLAALEDTSLLKRFPALAAISDVAGPALREAATIGGNLCLDTRCVFYNQSKWWRKANKYCLKLDGDTCHVAPQGERCHAAFSGDVAPALLVLGAEIKIANADGERWQPLNDLYKDDGLAHLTLAPEDILVAIRIPMDAAKLRSGYRKSRIRKAIDFPLTGVAVALQRDKDAITELRIAITGTNSRPILIDDFEGVIGQEPDEPLLKAVTKQIGALIKPMRTTNLPGNYRRHVTGILAQRLISDLYDGIDTTG